MNISELNALSLSIISQRAPTDICWIIGATIAFTTNLLVVITICLSKPLRNKSQFVIVSYCLAEAMRALTYFCTGFARFSYFLYGVPSTTSQLTCMLWQIPLFFTATVTSFLSVVLAVDRLMGVAVPVYYHTIDPFFYILLINLICWVYPMIKMAFGFLKYDENLYFPVCGSVTSFDSKFYNFHVIESDVTVILAALAYVVAVSILFIRYKKKTFSNQIQKSEWKRRIELDVFIAVAAIGIIYILVWGVVTVLDTVAANIFSLNFSVILALIVPGLGFFSVMSHLFVFLYFNSIFRKCFIALFFKCKKSNAVHPAL